MPGCLGLDAMWQLIWLLSWLACGEVKAVRLGVGELNSPDKYYQQQKKVTYKIDFKRVINRKLIVVLPMVKCMLMVN